jgi:hypothetical protein
MSAANPIARQGMEPTILVVDDNKGVLEFLLLLLSQTRAVRHRCVER